jgi:uncharacterized protein (TIGR02246 family)
MIAQKSQRFAVILLSLGIALVSLSPMAFAAKKEKHSIKNSKHSDVTVTSSGDPKSDVASQIVSLAKILADGDAAKLAALWTENGTYTDEDGALFKGRTALEKRFSEVFVENGRQPVNFIQNPIQMLADTVALAEGVVSRNEGVGMKPQTRYSIVLVKQNGDWLISNATETPLAVEENQNPLSDLAWIIGEWSAERDGKSVRMKAEWAPNNKFIQCRYEIKNSANAPAVESREVIGWDPRIGQPVSWHFDSSGGFGHGDWFKENNSWIVRATGVDREGNTTFATDILSLTAPDAISWQSVNRSVDGIAYNDSAPLKVVRVAK